jgi:Methyl-accepting chemotaxis protein
MFAMQGKRQTAGVSIRWKILGLALGLSIGFMALLGVAMMALRSTNEGLSQMRSTYYPVLVAAQANREAIERMAETFNTAVTIGELDSLTVTKQYLQEMEKRFKEQSRLLPGKAADIDKLAADTQSYYAAAFGLAESIIQGKADMGKVSGIAAENSQKLQSLTTALTKFQMQREKDFTSLVDQADERTGRTASLLWIIWAVLLVGGLSWAIWTANGISYRVLKVANSLNEMSRGNADLTLRLHSSAQDEMGNLTAAFNRFMDKLQTNIRETVESIHQLESAMLSLTQSSNVTSSCISDQHNAIEQTTQALGEMFVSFRHIAEHAAEASSAASGAEEEAHAGGKVVAQTIDGINQVAEEVSATAQVIVQLESYTNNVGSILDAIRGIADQTNLLALNAAIEAARAGEQGRGFAVVADEVRTLASRTQVSTGEIQKVLQELQSSSRNAVVSMEHAKTLAQQAVGQSGKSGQSLQQITGSVSGITAVNNQIAAATEEQHATSQLIQGYVEEIQQMAQSAIRATGELGDVSAELRSVTERLQHVATQFKV